MRRKQLDNEKIGQLLCLMLFAGRYQHVDQYNAQMLAPQSLSLNYCGL